MFKDYCNFWKGFAKNPVRLVILALILVFIPGGWVSGIFSVVLIAGASWYLMKFTDFMQKLNWQDSNVQKWAIAIEAMILVGTILWRSGILGVIACALEIIVAAVIVICVVYLIVDHFKNS